MTPPFAGKSLKSFILRFALPVVAAWMCLLPICFQAIEDSDAGWHLAQGRIISATGLFSTNRLAWTAPDSPWYPTSWLYDVLAYQMVAHLGLTGMQLLSFALAALTMLLLALVARQIDPLGAWVVPAITLLMLPRVTERPHVASWAILSAVLALGLAGESRGWKYRLACLPVLAIGSNLHPGAIFGTGICGLFCLQAMWCERHVLRELAIAAGAVLALMANPGGVFDIVDTVRHLWVGQVVQIAEFQRPSWIDSKAFFILLPILLVLSAVEWKRRPILLPITAAFALVGCLAIRATFELELIGAMSLAAGFGSIGRTAGIRTQALALALLNALALTYRTPRFAQSRWEAAFDARRFPVQAASFVEREHLGGHAFNSFSDGGYLEHAIPGFLAFQDGRIHAFPDAFFPEETRAEKEPSAFQSYLRAKGVEWALVTRKKESLAGYEVMTPAEWALVYWDDVRAIWLRRDIPRFSALLSGHEYRFVTPDLRPLPFLRGAGRSDLARAREEADRLDRETGGTATVTSLVRCGADVRLRSPDAPRTCGQAVAMASDDVFLGTLDRIRALPPVAGSESH